MPPTTPVTGDAKPVKVLPSPVVLKLFVAGFVPVPEPVKTAPLIFTFAASKTLIACVKTESDAMPESASPVSVT